MQGSHPREKCTLVKGLFVRTIAEMRQPDTNPFTITVDSQSTALATIAILTIHHDTIDRKKISSV